jgi:ABC-2 type transport system permease protein
VEWTEQGAGLVSQLACLLKAKLMNMRPSKRGRLGRILLLLLFAVLICGSCYKTAVVGTEFLLSIDPSNPRFGFLVARRLIEFGLLFLLSILGVSSLISSLSGFYLARDLELLHTIPIRRPAMYLARLTEVVFQSTWVLFPMIVPTFWGMGVALEAPVIFFVAVPFAVLSLMIPICAFCVVVATFIACWVPASRIREFFLAASGFMFVGVYMMVRAARPEQFVHPGKFKTVPALLESLGVSNAYLPSAWAADALLWGSGHQIEHGLRSFLSLCMFFVISLSLGLLVHYRWYEQAKSRAREVKQSPKKRAEWLVWIFGQLGAALGRKGIDRAMLEKEAKLVLRDPQQWTQILMLIALMVLFVYNFRYVDELNLPEGVELLFSLGVSGFVLGALGARFVFPLVSLESTAFWILRSAPISSSKILSSKAWGAFIVLELLGLGMSLAAAWALNLGVQTTLLSLLLVTPIAILASVLGVGLGGSYPQFNFENPVMIPMSYGGMIYVYWSMGTILVYCVLLAWPLYAMSRPLVLQNDLERVLTVALGLIALVIPLVSAWIGFRMGCQRLSEA